MYDKTIEIEKILPKEELNALKDIVIFRETDGSYNLYGKYTISKDLDGLYIIEVLGTHTQKSFYKLRNAVVWCSYDKRNLLKDSKRIHQLDQMIFSMDTEIYLHSNLIKKAQSSDFKIIYLSKLIQNKAKKRKYSEEIYRYLLEYQRWQTKLFDTKPKY